MAGEIWLIDIDDTLTHSVNAALEYYNSTHDKKLVKEDFTTYSISQAHLNRYGITITLEEEKKIMLGYYQSPFFENVKPIIEMKQVIEAIVNNKDIAFATTGRPKKVGEVDVEAITKRMIKKYFGDNFKKFFFTEWVQGVETNGSKRDIAIEYGARKVIDDMPRFVNDLSGLELVKGIYVPRNPWNTSVQETEKIKIITYPKQIIEYAYKNVA